MLEDFIRGLFGGMSGDREDAAGGSPSGIPAGPPPPSSGHQGGRGGGNRLFYQAPKNPSIGWTGGTWNGPTVVSGNTGDGSSVTTSETYQYPKGDK